MLHCLQTSPISNRTRPAHIGIGDLLMEAPSHTTTRTGHVSGDSADPKPSRNMGRVTSWWSPLWAIPAELGFLAIRPLWSFQRLLQYNHKAETLLTTLIYPNHSAEHRSDLQFIQLHQELGLDTPTMSSADSQYAVISPYGLITLYRPLYAHMTVCVPSQTTRVGSLT